MVGEWLSSGNAGLDGTIRGLLAGDNVVWQVDDLDDYTRFAEDLVRETLAGNVPCVYLRFASHPPLLQPRQGLNVVEIDPGAGFDVFSAQVHRLIARYGKGAVYVFDNLSALVEPWATDELLANFFRVTCPYLHELDTIAYFALSRGRHTYEVVAQIAATSQIVIDVYRLQQRLYVHPIKVWMRYSPQMFLPHRVDDGRWTPILDFPDVRATPGAPEVADDGVGSIAPWNSVYTQLARLRQMDGAQDAAIPEATALRTELRRMLMGDDETFAVLADRYLTLDDLLSVRERLIGSGRIGGKAAGMLLARRILQTVSHEEGATGGDPSDLAVALDEHDSFYVGSDVFFTFLVMNGLFRRRLELHNRGTLTRDEYKVLETRFLEGRFPPVMVDRFREMLEHFGERPIIVRSSSLFEDSFGHAFAGKYESLFCGNRGSIEERLEALMRAVKQVYASALSPDALSYRRNHDLLFGCDEQMAILVQAVSGEQYGSFYFPPLAGVAFSRNLYPWTDRIDPMQGMIRLVFGLGTRAVDRVEDYPRMIAISHPHIRPESGRQIVRYSQRRMDVIDLEANALQTRSVAEVLGGLNYPHLDYYVSQVSDGMVYDAPTALMGVSVDDLVLTFNRLTRRTDFVSLMAEMLRRLEKAYGRPVDIEFAARLDGERRVRIDLLQCRPMNLPGLASQEMPLVDPERVLFRANRMIGAGLISDIRHIVYVDPVAYGALGASSARGTLGRLMGRLNAHPRLADVPLMMMGPGRWGSSNTQLGVNVTYADIDSTEVLVEIAREDGGHLPEVSYGTHFFQDLVEDRIVYLPLYPDDPKSEYNAAFFESAVDILPEILPDSGEFAGLVRVIDVAATSGGALAHVVASPEAHEAVCYLE